MEPLTDYICYECGDYIQDDEPMAEVVFIGQADTADELDDLSTHVFVHQECFDENRHVVA